MSCQKHGQLAAQVNQQKGSVLPTIDALKLLARTPMETKVSIPEPAEIRAEFSSEQEIAVITLDSVAEAYPRKQGLENLVTNPDLDLATWLNLLNHWREWVKQTISLANRTCGAEIDLSKTEIEDLGTYYLANGLAKFQNGELTPQPCSEALFENLSQDQQELILLLDNERALYYEKQLNENLTIPGGHPFSEPELLRNWQGWVKRGYQLFQTKLDFPELESEELKAVAKYYLQTTKEEIAAGRLKKLAAKEMDSPEKRTPFEKKEAVQKTVLSPERIEEILTQAVPDGNQLRINEKLDKAAYAKVAQALKKLEGKWVGGKVQAIVFEKDAQSVMRQYLQTKKFPDLNPFDFYQTPEKLATNTVQLLGDLKPAARILEPSAGEGSLAKAVKSQYPQAMLEVLEIDPERGKRLAEQGFNLVGTDFLALPPEETYDGIVLNPPFRQGIYADHILHAYKMLKPGGKVVAIAPTSVQFSENNAKIKAIRDLNPAFNELPENSFAESGTAVNTCQVILTKPLK